MGQNLTLANNENGDLLYDDRLQWYTYTSTSNMAYVKFNLALSDLDLENHTIKITSNWSWHKGGSQSSGWAWDYNSGDEGYKLYATGTSSSSGTSKTYYLYTGGNKESYGTLTAGSTYFNWAAAYGNSASGGYQDINYEVNQKIVNNTITVDLADDNSLTMSIATQLTTKSSSGYGPRTNRVWTTYTLTINPTGAFLWVNDGGTWKRGLVYVNDGGTWRVGKATYINAAGTWTKS